MLRCACLLASLAASSLVAADWGPLAFLVGNWTGEGGGAPGQSLGGFSFTSDLQGKVLVRKSYAEYPPANGKPASRHEDLTVVYRENGKKHAIYFDNEDHTIRYQVEAVPGGVVFASEGPGPRFRLTYLQEGAQAVKIRFEIAAPGKDFATYLEARARRQ